MNKERDLLSRDSERWQRRNFSRVIAIGVFLLALLFVASAHGQTKVKGFDFEYDKFKDKTSVQFSGFGTGLRYVALFEHSGAQLSTDQQDFWLYFGGSCRGGFCFNSASLILLIDGERVPAGTDDGLGDSVMFVIPRTLLTRIGTAKIVEYQVGRFEGKWKDGDLAKFKTLLDIGTVKK